MDNGGVALIFAHDGEVDGLSRAYTAAITLPTWYQLIDRYWLGGFQDLTSPNYSEPSGGWTWVTGEPWSYTNWFPGEPNNTGGGEDYLGACRTWRRRWRR